MSHDKAAAPKAAEASKDKQLRVIKAKNPTSSTKLGSTQTANLVTTSTHRTYHDTGTQTLPPHNATVFRIIHGCEPNNEDMATRMGLAALGRFTRNRFRNAYDVRYGRAYNVELVAKSHPSTDTEFQTLEADKRKLALTKAKTKGCILAKKYNSHATERGVDLYSETNDNKVVHTEQYPFNVQIDADGHISGESRDNSFLPNVWAKDVASGETGTQTEAPVSDSEDVVAKIWQNTAGSKRKIDETDAEQSSPKRLRVEKVLPNIITTSKVSETHVESDHSASRLDTKTQNTPSLTKSSDPRVSLSLSNVQTPKADSVVPPQHKYASVVYGRPATQPVTSNSEPGPFDISFSLEVTISEEIKAWSRKSIQERRVLSHSLFKSEAGTKSRPVDEDGKESKSSPTDNSLPDIGDSATIDTSIQGSESITSPDAKPTDQPNDTAAKVPHTENNATAIQAQSSISDSVTNIRGDERPSQRGSQKPTTSSRKADTDSGRKRKREDIPLYNSSVRQRQVDTRSTTSADKDLRSSEEHTDDNKEADVERRKRQKRPQSSEVQHTCSPRKRHSVTISRAQDRKGSTNTRTSHVTASSCGRDDQSLLRRFSDILDSPKDAKSSNSATQKDCHHNTAAGSTPWPRKDVSTPPVPARKVDTPFQSPTNSVKSQEEEKSKKDIVKAHPAKKPEITKIQKEQIENDRPGAKLTQTKKDTDIQDKILQTTVTNKVVKTTAKSRIPRAARPDVVRYVPRALRKK